MVSECEKSLHGGGGVNHPSVPKGGAVGQQSERSVNKEGPRVSVNEGGGGVRREGGRSEKQCACCSVLGRVAPDYWLGAAHTKCEQRSRAAHQV